LREIATASVDLFTHESVEHHVAEARVTGKTTVAVLHHVLNVLGVRDLAHAGSDPIRLACWIQRWESQAQDGLGAVPFRDGGGAKWWRREMWRSILAAV